MLKIKQNLKFLRYFGSGGHKIVYDWRDDPSKNILYQPQIENFAMDPKKIKLPHVAPLMKFKPTAQFSHSNDPTKVFKAEKILLETAIPIPMPYNNVDENVDHERDYMSEDYQTVPDTIAGNHFRRRGDGMLIFLWAFGMTVFYVWSEMFYGKFPDEEYFKKPRPPPLDFPSEEVSPDTEKLEY